MISEAEEFAKTAVGFVPGVGSNFEAPVLVS